MARRSACFGCRELAPLAAQRERRQRGAAVHGDRLSADLGGLRAGRLHELCGSLFDRQTQLYNVGAISKADYENSQSQYQTAQAQVGSSGRSSRR